MAISSKIRLNYARRLFLWLVGYSLLMVICFVTFQYHREKEFKAEELNAQLQIVNANVLADFSENDSLNANYLIGKHPFEDIRISIVSHDGKVVYDNSLDTLPQSNHLSREEIARAVALGEGYTIRRHSESTGGTYFYSAKSGDRYIVRTAVPYSTSLSSLLKADRRFLWFMAGVTLIMCVIGYFATHKLGVVIGRLNVFARRAEAGETIVNTEPFPHDELGDISNHIVRLYARLQKAMKDRDREHKAAMHEEQEKIRIKKQLTNNINHELKTPLASIQVCVETLHDHPDLPEEKRMDFLNRCLANIERLKQLLEDVAVITRIDDGGRMIEREPLNLNALVSEVCDDLSLKAGNKGMKILLEIDGDITVNGNLSLMSSIFHNLIDNAIAYSGGSEVKVQLARPNDAEITVTVEDDGSGVAPEHLPRLFERFYRVDKGRSRQAGGTGLGLSIVKNAVLIHGGTIIVANKPTGGLLFTITLPRT